MLEAKRINSTIKPSTIQRLNDGSYYYNYDIKESLVNTEEGEQIIYSYIQVMLRGVPSYKKCTQAIIRAYITEDQELALINTGGLEYKEYLTLLKEIKYNVGVDFNLIPRDDLEEAKSKKIFEIESYDSSSAINQFTYKGVPMWLDKGTRNGLLMRLNAEKAAGKTETTLWFEITSFNLTIEDAISMLNLLEIYASQCFDRTASHKAAVNSLNTIEEVNNYDYTVGYPSKLVFY